MKLKLAVLSIVGLFVLTACSTRELYEVPEFSINTVEDLLDGSSIFSNRDLRTYDEIDQSSITYITLDDNDLEITEEGIYELTGSISDGQIKINASSSDKIQLILNNVSITNSSCATIYVKKADKVFITMKDGTTNTLISNSLTDDIDGVIYSKDDITLNGYGTLNITSPIHGIVGNDDVVLAQATYNITSTKRGIDANDSIRINDGTYNITSGKDAIKADDDDDSKGFIYVNDGEFNIESLEDGFAASNVMEVMDGTFNISTGGGFDEILNDLTVGEGSGGVTQPTDLLTYTMQSIRTNGLIIRDGYFYFSSYEDCIHSNGNVLIEGGNINLLSGDDALHADDMMLITGGTISITNCYEGIEADFITITGGNIKVIGYDDGINIGSDIGVLTIAGGTIYVSTQGDCIDSNGDFNMTGGNVTLVSNAIYTMGYGPVDVTGVISFTGGTIVDGDCNDIDPNDSFSSSGSSRPGRF